MSLRAQLFDAARDAFRIGKVAAIVAVVVALLLYHVWNQYQITHLGYQISEQTHQHHKLMQQNRKLSIEAAYQGRTERMLSVAKKHFGLQPIRPEQVIEVDGRRAKKAANAGRDRPEYATLESAAP